MQEILKSLDHMKSRCVAYLIILVINSQCKTQVPNYGLQKDDELALQV